MKNDFKKFEESIKRLEAYKKKKHELAEAIAGYVLVADEKFLFKVYELIEKEENL